jgi:hypothetical protein
MNRYLLYALFLFTINSSLIAQTNPPAVINFQAVALDDNGRELAGTDANGIPISDKAIKVQFSIVTDNPGGPMQYAEVHLTNTDRHGLFTLNIGEGTPLIGKSLKDVNWHVGKKFLKVELDINNGKGYRVVSTQQILSVPYALYSGESLEAKKVDTLRIRDSVLHSTNIKKVQSNLDKHIKADQDTVPTNELQSISIKGGRVNLSLGGGSVLLPDSNSSNELQALSIKGGSVSLSEGGGTIKLPDSSDVNEIQTLSLVGNKLSISGIGGNSVTFDNQFEHYIGEYFGGGIIFHLWRDKTGEHGLIVNLNNQSSSQKWSNVSNALIGSTAQSSWDGGKNSNAIVNQVGHTNSAAQLCLNLSSDGYSDWYLPSIDELSLLWQNRFNVNNAMNGMSGVTQIPQLAYFWSSGEYSISEAWVFLFDVGYAGGISKLNSYQIRAIRKF